LHLCIAAKKTCTTLLPWTPEDLQSKWRSLNETPSACAGEKGLSKETVAGMYKVRLGPFWLRIPMFPMNGMPFLRASFVL
jgi:hypothetical protein